MAGKPMTANSMVRQELFDGNMHLTTSLTKRFCQVHITATRISCSSPCTRLTFVGHLSLD